MLYYWELICLWWQGAVSIIFRGKDQSKNEAEYVEKFANPFPASKRGRQLVSNKQSFPCLQTR